jgi:hypothetical protein
MGPHVYQEKSQAKIIMSDKNEDVICGNVADMTTPEAQPAPAGNSGEQHVAAPTSATPPVVSVSQEHTVETLALVSAISQEHKVETLANLSVHDLENISVKEVTMVVLEAVAAACGVTIDGTSRSKAWDLAQIVEFKIGQE